MPFLLHLKYKLLQSLLPFWFEPVLDNGTSTSISKDLLFDTYLEKGDTFAFEKEK